MMRPSLLLQPIALGLIVSGSAMATEIDFSRDVKPILLQHCVHCHGAETAEVDLRVDSVTGLLRGGNTGPSIVRGKSAESLLIHKITAADRTEAMPPEDEGELLTTEEIAVLRRWIDAGAIGPIDEEAAKPARKKIDHWSFQPLAEIVPPTVSYAGWVRNPIDAFILHRLDAEGIKPSPEASRATLISRLSLDLLGLPPSPEEVQAFEQDESPNAYEQLVDRLLESPHYGERWGRHWLDLARYSDSNGYTIDSARVIWPYRDWVIESLNADMPFDQFVIEQFAGDMLPNATKKQMIATGFHRNTPLNEEGGTDKEEFRIESVIDRVSTTGSAFLGLSVGCARCHDHKYDPISQREFYQLIALMNNADEPKLPIRSRKKEKITTLVMDERDTPRETRIMLRGEYPPKGVLVSPALPAVLPGFPEEVTSPNRLDFARWLVSPSNPLTPRVTVNRIWQHYFGRGIVETESDFGTQGTRPTHPELLDYLAGAFVREGWSLKALHRLIVSSATYRQASLGRTDLRDRDPQNKLIARQSRLRLDAEIIRDRALVASGLFSPKIGGPSVYPPRPGTTGKLTQRERKWEVSNGTDRYRRGMYTFSWRSNPHPVLSVFNAADSTFTCTRRDRANTPLQSLVLLNDEALFEAAQALALRLLASDTGDDISRIDLAFQISLARLPTDDERAALLTQLTAEREDASHVHKLWKTPVLKQKPSSVDIHELTVWTMIARTLMNCDEFITRE
jgi:hypothetical protein